MTSIEDYTDPMWYVDLVTGSHYTPTFENLQISNGHSGNDQIYVGNGASLPISSVGKYFLP